MTLKDKILDPNAAVRLFEVVPPPADKPQSTDKVMAELTKVRHLADAVNLPEIHDESRGGAERTAKFVPRLEPRRLGARIRRELGMEVVINRCVVYDPNQTAWFEETQREYGIDNVVLVGGESSGITYPGPSVTQAAAQLRAAGLRTSLGGITIPSRLHEADRIRKKHATGLDFFTTQILFDSNDIVWLIQQLNGVESRIFLSFAPVSHPRDLEFLRWLGADIPADLDSFLLHGHAPPPGTATAEVQSSPSHRPGTSCLRRSLDLAQRILMDVFDNLPPDPPPIGLNIEHINQRNFAPALEMLELLGSLYSGLVASRALRTSPAPLP
jgi:5,10-methylenetetrahydrofolate reductase